MATALTDNARDLEGELAWFAGLLEARLHSYFTPGETPAAMPDIPSPDLRNSKSLYAQFVRHYELSLSERLVIVLALIPHIRPQLLDVFFSTNDRTDRAYAEFGGVPSTMHPGFIPTGQTAAFMLAGDNLAARFEMTRLFDGDHFFARHNLVSLSPVGPGEPLLGGALTISHECLRWVTTGIEERPRFNSDFPAQLIDTQLTWDDLVLPSSTLEQLEEVKHWILYGPQLLHEWEMKHKLRPGFNCIFFGPPGTGKTLSACLLGKHCGCDVYRIDLSMVVSKYIGETEKNLARVFDMAEDKNWILFFDEADALFGKRTKVEDAHDRYANLEISFLLQRIEAFGGVTILASNMKTNIDDAFLRRFHSVVTFPMPRPMDRLHIWQNAFSPKAALEKGVDLQKVAEKYDLSGGTIMNVVRYSSLKALSRRASTILLEDLEEGIRRECLKEGRTL